MANRLVRPRDRMAIWLGALAISLAGVSHAATPPTVTILKPVTESLSTPLKLTFDSQGNYFVTDPRAGGVAKFSAAGERLALLKTSAPPRAIALAGNGTLLVSHGTYVAVLDQNGTETGRFGAGQLRKATGIAVDAAGYVYVADSLANSVKVFTARGQFVQTIGTPGTGAGQFSMPTAIAYEKSANQIAVADTLNGRIQFFSASAGYRHVKTIGSFGNGPLQFRWPVGVTFEYDGAGALNRMYVVDSYLSCVKAIDPAGDGTLLATIGTNGFAAGQLLAPRDLAFDQANRRIAVANGSGYLTLYGIDGGTSPSPATLSALAIDPVTMTVTTPSITISGTVEPKTSVVVRTETAAAASPVVYTSATTWKCTITGLTAGSNPFTVTATTPAGTIAKQSAYVTYAP